MHPGQHPKGPCPGKIVISESENVCMPVGSLLCKIHERGRFEKLRPVRFINIKKPDEYSFAIPIKNFQKVDIKPPFEVRDLPSYKCYSAYFVSETEEPSAAFNRLRRMATEAGYSLTGQDRIVYLQMLFSDRNIYELQVGIR